MKTATSRDGLHLTAPRSDNPWFELRVQLAGVPVGQADAAIADARRRLLLFLTDAADWDWPLTFWFSTAPLVLGPTAASGKPDAGTASYVVILRVVGDGAARRLARAAEKAGLTKEGR